MSTPAYLQSPPLHTPFSNQLDLDVTETLSHLLPGLKPGSFTKLRIYPCWNRSKMWNIFEWEKNHENKDVSQDFEAYLERINSIEGTVTLPDNSIQYWCELAPGVKALFFQTYSPKHA